ncbi:hypothetical protein AcV7_004983 [Taiwanofungus camphoratus]|nr:hypothetical protein AcV7_004983 [Antrodia cinnamomea]
MFQFQTKDILHFIANKLLSDNIRLALIDVLLTHSRPPDPEQPPPTPVYKPPPTPSYPVHWPPTPTASRAVGYEGPVLPHGNFAIIGVIIMFMITALTMIMIWNTGTRSSESYITVEEPKICTSGGKLKKQLRRFSCKRCRHIKLKRKKPPATSTAHATTTAKPTLRIPTPESTKITETATTAAARTTISWPLYKIPLPQIPAFRLTSSVPIPGHTPCASPPVLSVPLPVEPTPPRFGVLHDLGPRPFIGSPLSRSNPAATPVVLPPILAAVTPRTPPCSLMTSVTEARQIARASPMTRLSVPLLVEPSTPPRFGILRQPGLRPPLDSPLLSRSKSVTTPAILLPTLTAMTPRTPPCKLMALVTGAGPVARASPSAIRVGVPLSSERLTPPRSGFLMRPGSGLLASSPTALRAAPRGPCVGSSISPHAPLIAATPTPLVLKSALVAATPRTPQLGLVTSLTRARAARFSARATPSLIQMSVSFPAERAPPPRFGLVLRAGQSPLPSSPIVLRSRSGQAFGSPVVLRSSSGKILGSPAMLRTGSGQVSGSPIMLRFGTGQVSGSPISLRSGSSRAYGSPIPIHKRFMKDMSRISCSTPGPRVATGLFRSDGSMSNSPVRARPSFAVNLSRDSCSPRRRAAANRLWSDDSVSESPVATRRQFACHMSRASPPRRATAGLFWSNGPASGSSGASFFADTRPRRAHDVCETDIFTPLAKDLADSDDDTLQDDSIDLFLPRKKTSPRDDSPTLGGSSSSSISPSQITDVLDDDGVENISRDDGVGYFLNDDDTPLIEYLLVMNGVTSYVLFEVEIHESKHDPYAVIVIQIAMSPPDAHPDDPPCERLVRVKLLPENDAAVQYRLWLNGHALGIQILSSEEVQDSDLYEQSQQEEDLWEHPELEAKICEAECDNGDTEIDDLSLAGNLEDLLVAETDDLSAVDQVYNILDDLETFSLRNCDAISESGRQGNGLEPDSNDDAAAVYEAVCDLLMAASDGDCDDPLDPIVVKDRGVFEVDCFDELLEENGDEPLEQGDDDDKPLGGDDDELFGDDNKWLEGDDNELLEGEGDELLEGDDDELLEGDGDNLFEGEDDESLEGDVTEANPVLGVTEDSGREAPDSYDGSRDVLTDIANEPERPPRQSKGRAGVRRTAQRLRQAAARAADAGNPGEASTSAGGNENERERESRPRTGRRSTPARETEPGSERKKKPTRRAGVRRTAQRHQRAAEKTEARNAERAGANAEASASTSRVQEPPVERMRGWQTPPSTSSRIPRPPTNPEPPSERPTSSRRPPQRSSSTRGSPRGRRSSQTPSQPSSSAQGPPPRHMPPESHSQRRSYSDVARDHPSSSQAQPPPSSRTSSRPNPQHPPRWR